MAKKRARDSSSCHYALIEQNIFTQRVDAICHQCNTTSIGRAAGIADTIFTKECPRANTYKSDINRELGNIHIFEASKDKPYRFIVNMYAQKRKGKCTSSTEDTPRMRELWFELCLTQLEIQARRRNINSVAFPYGIGCNLAGGSWENYSHIINEFAERNPDLKVIVCRLPPVEPKPGVTERLLDDSLTPSTGPFSDWSLKKEMTQVLTCGHDDFQKHPHKETLAARPSLAWLVDHVSRLDDSDAASQVTKLAADVNTINDQALLNQVLAELCELPINTGHSFSKFIGILAKTVNPVSEEGGRESAE
jgi:O-acetyl-ADP-ribose deacetylase (regulator of RNase III)